jgi:hypothetical protein
MKKSTLHKFPAVYTVITLEAMHATLLTGYTLLGEESMIACIICATVGVEICLGLWGYASNLY